MKIIIIGDGKVGYKLARQLSTEKYDVVLIDSDEKKLRFATDHLDIACVAGNGADAEVLKQADIAHADLAIACTSEDECNMLSCLIARKLGARHTIARVRNPIYYRQIGLLKEDLHLSMAVNPELIVADEISRLLIFPDASQIETFVKGRMELLELPVSANGVLEGMRLSDMYRKFQIRLLVCAVERGEDVRIPDGEYVLKAGDRLHIAASHKDLERFFKANGKRREKIKKVIICGGGMSVDPDDRTPGGIRDTGAEIITYGAPVLPGAMLLVAYLKRNGRQIPVLGLPGCVMYAKRTVFDLILPRIMADDKIKAEEINALGEGGLCLNCPVCTFPNCGFGK